MIWSHFACPSYFLADTKIAIPTIDLVLQRHLSDFVSTALEEDVVPIVHVSSTCKLQDLLNQCIQRIAVSTLDSGYLEKELPDDIFRKIKQISQSAFQMNQRMPLGTLSMRRGLETSLGPWILMILTLLAYC